MNYLKTVEVANYVGRDDIEVDSGSELKEVRIASRLADNFCNRTLSIKYYNIPFELNRSLVGQVPMKPIIGIYPSLTTTGLRIRPLRRTVTGGREATGVWIDATIPTDLRDLLDKQTGRIELFSSFDTDYARLFYGQTLSRTRDAYAWLAEIEIKAGFLVDTKLTAGASSGATQITVKDSAGVVVNETYLTVGDTITGSVPEYLVTAVNGNILTISPGLGAAAAINTEITEVVPDDIKAAVAMIIEDRRTYSPNAILQKNVLDVIADLTKRVDGEPIPHDAAALLSDYKNYIMV